MAGAATEEDDMFAELTRAADAVGARAEEPAGPAKQPGGLYDLEEFQEPAQVQGQSQRSAGTPGPSSPVGSAGLEGPTQALSQKMEESEEPMKQAPDLDFDGSPIEDDGTVDLALMATEHQEIRRFGDVIFEHMRTANELLKQCAAWIKAGEYPTLATPETYQLVQIAQEAVHKDVERLDSVNLNEMKAAWCSKVPSVGATLTVLEPISYKFPKQPEKNYDLKFGLKGTVKQVDTKGDLYVTWEGLGGKWLLSQQMEKVCVDDRQQAVRMARRTIIEFAEVIMKRLDNLKDRLTGPVAELKQRRTQRAKLQSPDPSEDLTLEEKYKDVLDVEGRASEKNESVVVDLEAQPEPLRKRPRTSSSGLGQQPVIDTQALLQKLLAKVGRPLQPRPLSALQQQLLTIAASPNLATSKDLCRDAVECCLATVKAALEKKPTPDVKARLDRTLRAIDTLSNPEGLSRVLMELVNAVTDI